MVPPVEYATERPSVSVADGMHSVGIGALHVYVAREDEVLVPEVWVVAEGDELFAGGDLAGGVRLACAACELNCPGGCDACRKDRDAQPDRFERRTFEHGASLYSHCVTILPESTSRIQVESAQSWLRRAQIRAHRGYRTHVATPSLLRQAGIQKPWNLACPMIVDCRFRGNDKRGHRVCITRHRLTCV